MNRTTRIFFLVALGILMGGTIASHVGHGWFGLIMGVAVGAGFGYIVADFDQLVTAIPIAWHCATAWRPDREYWKAYRKHVIAFGFMIANEFLILVIILESLSVYFDLIPANKILGLSKMMTYLVLNLGVMVFIGYFGILVGMVTASDLGTDRMAKIPQELHPFSVNPVRFFFWEFPKMIYWMIVRIPKAFMIAGLFIAWCWEIASEFVVQLFRLVHSEERVLYSGWIATGVVASYFIGHLLICALVGGLCAALDYEIISVRCLKIAGAKSMFK